jgi:hypothetical protein
VTRFKISVPMSANVLLDLVSVLHIQDTASDQAANEGTIIWKIIVRFGRILKLNSLTGIIILTERLCESDRTLEGIPKLKL